MIVTNVQVLGGAPILQAPLLEEALYTVAAVSLMTGQSKDNIRKLLSRYPDLFDPPRWQSLVVRGRRGQRWPRRILSAKDVATIRELYPVK